VLISSHLLSEVALSVDDVVVIAHGRLRAAGRLDEVLGAGGEVATLVRSPDAGRLAGLLEGLGYTVERDGPESLLVLGAPPALVGAVAAEHRVPLEELRTRSGSLEDAFLALTEEAA
jgi:ABC-2 type transport system ATP-binding protein